MAPARLVFAWLLFTMRMVTSAEYLEPEEEEGELTSHTHTRVKCQGSNTLILRENIFLNEVITVIFHIDNYWCAVVSLAARSLKCDF